VGEKAILKCRADYAYGDSPPGGSIPPGATLLFDCELVGFAPKKKEKFEMSTAEKVAEATALKEQGTALFKAGQFAEAAAAYVEGVSYLEYLRWVGGWALAREGGGTRRGGGAQAERVVACLYVSVYSDDEEEDEPTGDAASQGRALEITLNSNAALAYLKAGMFAEAAQKGTAVLKKDPVRPFRTRRGALDVGLI
jgi:tetratricopeptide (TPR) repeat protein